MSDDIAKRGYTVPSDVVYDIFGREISMGKSMGLMAMVSMVSNYAKKATVNYGAG